MGNGWKLRLVYPHYDAIFSWEIHGKYMGEIHGKYMEIVHWNPYWALFYSTVSKVARVEKHPKHLDGCHQNLRRAAVLRCCSSRALLQGRHLTWPFSTSWAAYIEMYRGIGQGLARWNQMDMQKLVMSWEKIGPHISDQSIPICTPHGWIHTINIIGFQSTRSGTLGALLPLWKLFGLCHLS